MPLGLERDQMNDVGSEKITKVIYHFHLILRSFICEYELKLDKMGKKVLRVRGKNLVKKAVIIIF